MVISKWTKKNPYHFPIYLFIEIKQMFYEDLMTGLKGVKCEDLTQIKEEILDIFSLDTFILPNHIQGNQTSIQLALKQQRQDELSGDYTYKNYGWTPLYQSLGKLIPVFLDDVHHLAENLYSTCDTLKNFFFIAQSQLYLPYSSIITVSNTITDNLVNIQGNGQLIRLLLGYGNNNLDQIYQLTKPYGIHMISSDSNQCDNTQLCQDLENDFRTSTILCNDYCAPAFCNFSLPYI
jgi:hypothetical protein